MLGQAALAPQHVRDLLRLKSAEWLRPLLRYYPILVRLGLRPIIQRLLMPPRYLQAVRDLDHRAPEQGSGAAPMTMTSAG